MLTPYLAIDPCLYSTFSPMSTFHHTSVTQLPEHTAIIHTYFALARTSRDDLYSISHQIIDEGFARVLQNNP
jgi:hypothetical protein